jgi:dihydropteroate synthase
MALGGWSCGRFGFAAKRGSHVMGILNVTPDSFSDGGCYAGSDAAIAAGMRMLEDGAAIVDVGGESTRPGSDPVSPEDELARVLPVVRALAGAGACVSIDTRHAAVAADALAAGASILNDVSGFSDPEMVRVAVGSDAGLIVMHMLGEPKTMQTAPEYTDVVAEVSRFLDGRARRLVEAGVAPERIAVDPGIGFGKTTGHNLALLRHLDALGPWPVIVGASRKRFIGEITGVTEPRERLAGSLAAALFASARGALVVRVHDVAATVQALAVLDALDGGGGDPS